MKLEETKTSSVNHASGSNKKKKKKKTYFRVLEIQDQDPNSPDHSRYTISLSPSKDRRHKACMTS
jgi:hypothetical protein